MRTTNRCGFTLVELLVVIAMLMLLAGAVTTSVGSATRRGKISQATAEVREMTNAILAYENYGKVGDTSPLDRHVGEVPAEEGNMAFILGQETLQNGQSGKIPVLYNGQVRNGALRDPWGHPYIVTIRKAQISPDAQSLSLQSYVHFPNANRLKPVR